MLSKGGANFVIDIKKSHGCSKKTIVHSFFFSHQGYLALMSNCCNILAELHQCINRFIVDVESRNPDNPKLWADLNHKIIEVGQRCLTKIEKESQ